MTMPTCSTGIQSLSLKPATDIVVLAMRRAGVAAGRGDGVRRAAVDLLLLQALERSLGHAVASRGGAHVWEYFKQR